MIRLTDRIGQLVLVVYYFVSNFYNEHSTQMKRHIMDTQYLYFRKESFSDVLIADGNSEIGAHEGTISII